MDFNSFKILQEINKYNDLVDTDVILEKVKLPKDDFLEILYELKKNHYIKLPGDAMVETTNKGKTFLSSCILSWLIHNSLSIIAIIISIIALFN